LIDKIVPSLGHAIAGLKDGDTLLIGGFGDSGIPYNLIQAIIEVGIRDLVIVTNNAGSSESGVAALIKSGAVRKVIASYPRSKGSVWFEEFYKKGAIELELLPQGNLTEAIRAGGAGIGGFFTPVGAGTLLGKGREERMINGKLHIFQEPIGGDMSIISAKLADRWGNLTYSTSARNFGPSMAMAGDVTVVEVRKIVPLGHLDPEVIITPGIFVDRVVEVA
jgi:3-oxoadipate CoA-transferase alpha subunit